MPKTEYLEMRMDQRSVFLERKSTEKKSSILFLCALSISSHSRTANLSEREKGQLRAICSDEGW